jgi:UDP-glucose 4-epimerase
VRERTESDSEIVLVPYDEAYEEGFEDMLRRVPDTGKLHDLVGWEPKLTLDEILGDVIAHQRSEGEVP